MNITEKLFTCLVLAVFVVVVLIGWALSLDEKGKKEKRKP